MGEIVGGGTPKTDVKSYWNNGDIPWLTPADMKWVKGKYVSSGQRNITTQALQSSSAQLMPPGSVIYSSRAPIGYIAIAENALCTNQGFKSLVPIYTQLSDYLYYSLIAATPEIQSRASGTTFKEISGAEFGQTLVPLPPLAEQGNIVNKIESLLPVLETYNTKYNALSVLNEELRGKLKKSLLQHAIQGKLVPQEPTDEPARVLLERIAKERAKLGKKAAKSMSRIERRDRGTYEIFPDGSEKDISGEIPFDIPESWAWCRLREACFSFQYGTAKKSEKKGLSAVLRMGNIQAGEIDFSNLVFSNDSSDLLAYELRCGDVLFNRTNSEELVGKSAIFRGHNTPTIFAGYLIRIIKGDYLNSEYLNCFLNSPFAWMQGRAVLSLGVNQANISGEKLANYLFPLPPLKEQVRIISAIKSLPI